MKDLRITTEDILRYAQDDIAALRIKDISVNSLLGPGYRQMT